MYSNRIESHLDNPTVLASHRTNFKDILAAHIPFVAPESQQIDNRFTLQQTPSSWRIGITEGINHNIIAVYRDASTNTPPQIANFRMRHLWQERTPHTQLSIYQHRYQ